MTMTMAMAIIIIIIIEGLSTKNEGFPLELDRFKEREMRDIFRIEYLRRFKLVMKSHLNAKNKIKTANTWAVSLIRYEGRTNKWNKEELHEIDRKSRKILTMNKELHPRSDVSRIYVPRKTEGRGLTSCKSYRRREENILSSYVRNIQEVLLKKVGYQLLKDEIAKVWCMQKIHCSASCYWGSWSRINQL